MMKIQMQVPASQYILLSNFILEKAVMIYLSKL